MMRVTKKITSTDYVVQYQTHLGIWDDASFSTNFEDGLESLKEFELDDGLLVFRLIRRTNVLEERVLESDSRD